MTHKSPATHAQGQFSGELIQHVREVAATDAEAVSIYLKRLESAAGTERIRPMLTAEFLIGLSVVLRLARWEAEGLNDSSVADLPAARDLLDALFDYTAELQGTMSCIGDLGARVLRITIERLSWYGPAMFGADISVSPLTDQDEDSILDAIAEFLWNNRFKGRVNKLEEVEK
jgi:hypothetical protein